MTAGSRGTALFGAFSAAIFLAVYLSDRAPWLWLGLGLGLLVPAGVFLWKKRPVALLLCLGAAGGLLWYGAFRLTLFAPAQALDGARREVVLRVAEEPEAYSHGGSVLCWVAGEGKLPVRGVLCGGLGVLELEPGDRVEVRCDCVKTALSEEEPFTGFAAQGVFVKLYVQGSLRVEKARRAPWWCLPRMWGRKLAGSLRDSLPQDVAGLLAAMTAGDRSGLDGRTRTDLARSGISHLVALSGMHVCFLVSLLTRLTGYGPRRRLLVCGPILVFFTLAVGGASPVARACCFQLSALLAGVLGREVHPWTSLLGTLAFLLLLDPFAAGSVSLQLSFAAVAGIEVVTPRALAALPAPRLDGPGWVARRVNGALFFFRQTLATTLGALVFTLPLSAYYFGAVSLAAPLTNLLVLPVAALLFAGGLATGLVGMALPGLGAAMGEVLALPGRYVLWVARRVADFPYSSVPMTGLCYPGVLLGLYALALLALLGRGRRVRALVLCASVLVAAGICFSGGELDAGGLTAAVLDVGQGQSVVLVSQGQTALVDCGGSGYDDPGDVCADYLLASGLTQVDKLILTHYHADHTNGLEALFRRLAVGEVVLPRMEHDEDVQLRVLELARQAGARVTWIEENTDMDLGGAQLRLYAPLGDGGANEEGLSVLAGAGEFHMLITGDMNTVVEERLAARNKLPRCQVVVAGHHGSRYAAGDALLDAVRPQAAVISVGENVYGHPAAETLERLEERGIGVYRTDALGTVTIQVH